SPRASLDHTLSIARPRSLRALHPLPTRRSSALLADPGDLPSHARVDLRQHVRTEYLREVNSARHSAELENGDLMLRMLAEGDLIDRKSTRLNSSHVSISYAVFCWKKQKRIIRMR